MVIMSMDTYEKTMAYKIVVSKEATEDIEDIVYYSEKQSIYKWKNNQ